MKNNLIALKEQMKNKMSERDFLYAEILFLSYAYRSVLTILNNDPNLNRSNFDPISELQRWVLLSACYFVTISKVDFVGSYSMVSAYYQTYSLFNTPEILEILSSKGSLYYDDSREALLAVVFALYENETGKSIQSLLEENIT